MANHAAVTYPASRFSSSAADAEFPLVVLPVLIAVPAAMTRFLFSERFPLVGATLDHISISSSSALHSFSTALVGLLRTLLAQADRKSSLNDQGSLCTLAFQS